MFACGLVPSGLLVPFGNENIELHRHAWLSGYGCFLKVPRKQETGVDHTQALRRGRFLIIRGDVVERLDGDEVGLLIPSGHVVDLKFAGVANFNLDEAHVDRGAAGAVTIRRHPKVGAAIVRSQRHVTSGDKKNNAETKTKKRNCGKIIFQGITPS